VDARKQGAATFFEGMVDEVGCIGEIGVRISFEEEQFSEFKCQGGDTRDDFCSESLTLKLCDHQDGIFCFSFPFECEFVHASGQGLGFFGLHDLVGGVQFECKSGRAREEGVFGQSVKGF